MKTLKTLCAAAALLLAASAQSQPFYGQQLYPHGSSTLTSGQFCPVNTGYVMGGFTDFASGAAPDFVIDKVDGNGSLGGGGCFSEGYNIIDDISCAVPARVYNCVGVSVIESSNNAPGGETYALTGAYDKGVFFATLNAAGVVLKTYRWDFPFASNNVTKPFIRESQGSPGQYYICGAYNYDSYVIRINAAPAAPVPVWANWYTSGRIYARALIESPYNKNELMVVGGAEISPVPITSLDGFLLKLDANNGNIIFYNTYEKQIAGDEWFNCIEPATCIDASDCEYGGAFILGGRSVHPLIPYPSGTNWWYSPWMCKLDPAGNIIWTSLIEPFKASSYQLAMPADDISDVFERKSSSGRYEYYGVTKMRICPDRTNAANFNVLDNLTVFRLDQNGGSSLSPDEFHHVAGEAPMVSFLYSTGQLSNISGSTGDDGYQAYGTDLTGGNHYMTKAYFNGVSGCNDTIVNMVAVHAGPDSIRKPPLIANPFKANCLNNFSLSQTSLGTAETYLCFATSVAGGTNARPGATGVSSYDFAGEVGVYPNPTTKTALVSYYATEGSKAEIALYSVTGQLLQRITASTTKGGTQQAEIDLAGLNAASGVYFINVTVNGSTSRSKVIYSKE